MWTIVDKTTGKVLFAKFDNEVLEGQVAIEQTFSGEIPEDRELYFNFQSNEFELR